MNRLISMAIALLVAMAATMLLPRAARAQGQAWVQVEAQPTLAEAQTRARAYGARFADVAGFRMNTGWYAIVLGPYGADDAAARLAQLRAAGRIPGDSYVNTGAGFGQRFWPVGAGALAPVAPVAEEPGEDATAAAAAPAEAPTAEVPDETPAEARRSEAALDRAGREDLQRALAWFGHYTAAIDGAIGPGTRAAMSDWQAANGHPVTGVLTTAQRRALAEAWQAERTALGLEEVRETTAGIAMTVPTGLVAFDGYEPPFVRFAPRDDSGVQLRLISQTGTAADLAGLYDILQTLESIPTEGERGLSGQAFTIEGRDATRRAHAEAQLSGGLIKGFVLTWPAARDRQMTRALDEMRTSFSAFGDYAPAPDEGTTTEAQRRDLLAGLQLRRPDRTRSGFFVSDAGAVLTTAEAVDQCGRVTIYGDTEMGVAATDADLGLALLRPGAPLAPLGVARLRADAPRLDADVAVAGYAFGDAMSMPVLTFGRLADLRGLEGAPGADSQRRLTLATAAGDTGGPVLDVSGAVIGALLPRDAAGAGGRVLPPDVAFATAADAIAAFLSAAGVTPERAGRGPALAAEDLTTRAADFTVRVACWPE